MDLILGYIPKDPENNEERKEEVKENENEIRENHQEILNDFLSVVPENLRGELMNQHEMLNNNNNINLQSNEIDPNTFLYTLSEELREEVLQTLNDDYLSHLNPELLAQAQQARDRQANQYYNQRNYQNQNQQGEKEAKNEISLINSLKINNWRKNLNNLPSIFFDQLPEGDDEILKILIFFAFY